MVDSDLEEGRMRLLLLGLLSTLALSLLAYLRWRHARTASISRLDAWRKISAKAKKEPRKVRRIRQTSRGDKDVA